MKTPTKARIVTHGVEHSQYFQGHGTAFTPYSDCATGIGDTEKEAFADAMEQLAQGDWDTEAIEVLTSNEIPGLSTHTPRDISEQGEDGELHVWVSVDVA